MRCGQKSTTDLLSLKALFKLLWFRVLHFESRSLRFMGLLFIPGYVTTEFFKGRQKRNPQPIRFFFIIMFFFLFTINHVSDSGGMNTYTSYNGVRLESKEMKIPTEELKKMNFYEMGKRYTDYKILRQEIDSLPEALRTPPVRIALDSLLQRTYGNDTRYFQEFWRLANQDTSQAAKAADSMTLSLGIKQLKVATLDVFQYDAETIAQKYQVTTWLDKVMLSQGIKTLKDPNALMKAYLSSLAWTMLAIMGLMAGLLTLLYRKQHRYYVEHFIFLINEHSALFLLVTIALWINYFHPLGLLWAPLVVWMLCSPYLGMRRFYGQSTGILLLKYFTFFIFYLVGFALLFTIGMLLVFMIF